MFGFGKKKQESASPANVPAANIPPANIPENPSPVSPAVETVRVAQDPADAGNGASRRRPTPETIEVYDEFGRPMQIQTEEFRTKVLPGSLQANWDNPAGLYSGILQAVQLNFAQDVLPAAQRLVEIDPNPERSSVVMSIVLRDLGDAAQAEQVLLRQVAEHGESGIVLTNLAKAQTDLGREAEAEATLRRGVELDPNEENGLGWYGAMMLEKGRAEGRGDAGWDEAMEQFAELPGTWRPQLWLARSALQRNELETAFGLYRLVLERVPRPVPGDVLQQMSGELGQKGLLEALIHFTLPFYEPQVHGLAVGNNLIKASVDMGRLAEASALVEDLNRLGRPDWTQNLRYWETEIRKAQLGATPAADPSTIEVLTFAVQSPTWLQPESPARPLFPAVTGQDPRVLFFVATLATEEEKEMFKGEMADRNGRLTRMWGVFAAEWAAMHLECTPVTLVPYLKDRGFAISQVPVEDAQAVGIARQASSEFAVTAHITPAGDSFTLAVRVVRAREDGSPRLLGAYEVSAAWPEMGDAVLRMLENLKAGLAGAGSAPIAARYVPPRYAVPPAAFLPDYLLRLEQLLAAMCATGSTTRVITGEREMAQGMLQLAVNAPQALPPRLILLDTLRRFVKLRPEVVEEVRGQVELLQSRYPLADAEANTVVAQLVADLYAAPSA
ncbi:hypothetical protein [Silvibacterium sp.]|uniref:hypothetical protein n=1 Tax=Silvibacterium sp. TaxID=1964179 RepID=UPI0039E61B38